MGQLMGQPAELSHRTHPGETRASNDRDVVSATARFHRDEPAGAIHPPVQATARLALSKQEAAVALGVSVDFLESHVLHELRVVRCGRRRLIPVRELERWVEEHASIATARARAR